MINDTTIKELKNIVNDMENICVRMQNINLEGVDKWDKVSALHSMEKLAYIMLNQSKMKEVA